MKKAPMNILVIGHADHGKSEFSEALAKELGWSEASSSFLCKEIVFDAMKERGFAYATPEECWEDRNKERGLWKEIIHEYNTPDLTRLSRKIYLDNEIYTGLRKKEEFFACRWLDLYDVVIFVDAGERVGIPTTGDLEIPSCAATLIIDNNGTKEDLKEKVRTTAVFLNFLAELKLLGIQNPEFNPPFLANKLGFKLPSYLGPESDLWDKEYKNWVDNSNKAVIGR